MHIPIWALVHLPIAVTLSTAFFTPRGWVYCILYVLFENAMGVVKLWAVITGERQGRAACWGWWVGRGKGGRLHCGQAMASAASCQKNLSPISNHAFTPYQSHFFLQACWTCSARRSGW